MLDWWEPDVALKSIQFKTIMYDYSTLSSVQVSLTNGQSSPVFEKAGVDHKYPKTIDFDLNTPIRAVAAVGGGGSCLYCIRFMDGASNLFYEYSPDGFLKNGTKHALSANE